MAAVIGRNLSRASFGKFFRELFLVDAQIWYEVDVTWLYLTVLASSLLLSNK